MEPVASLVLSRSCFGVDAQQLVAADLESTVRRNLWISGAKANEEPRRLVPGRTFLDEKERRSICRHKHPFTGLISVCRDDGVCCVFYFVAQSRLVQPDSCDQQACTECLFLLLSAEEVCITFAFGECLPRFAALVF